MNAFKFYFFYFTKSSISPDREKSNWQSWANSSPTWRPWRAAGRWSRKWFPVWKRTVRDQPDAESANVVSFRESRNDSCCERGDDDDSDRLLLDLRRLSRLLNRLDQNI